MDNRKERDRARELSRRSMIKWSLAAGAALGLPRWQVFEILERSNGTALAQEATELPTNRSIHLLAGVGGFSWFQLLWPHNDVAAAGNNNFAYHAPGQQTTVQGTGGLLTLGPEAPWKDLPAEKQVTALMGGTNQTHTRTPNSNLGLGNNVSLAAAAAALQSTNPTLVPVIAIDGANIGNAPGAPRAAQVGNPNQIVDLFNSAASRAGGLLANSQDAEVFASFYRTFLSLNKAAGRATAFRAASTARSASDLLSQNLADRLRPSNEDITRYRLNTGAGLQNKWGDIGRMLIVTAKAFKMGLTSSVIMSCTNDDPHGAFNNMNDLRASVTQLGHMLNQFYVDTMAMDDDSAQGHKVGESVVLSVHGDTPKNPLDRGGWPDGTPQNSNWVYVFGNGHLKTGWFGGIDRNNNVTGYNPATGQAAQVQSAQLAQPAAAAVLYAVAKGDIRRVQQFYNGNINGLINADLTG